MTECFWSEESEADCSRQHTRPLQIYIHRGELRSGSVSVKRHFCGAGPGPAPRLRTGTARRLARARLGYNVALIPPKPESWSRRLDPIHVFWSDLGERRGSALNETIY